MRKTTKKRLLFSIILCLLYMFCMTGCYGNIETSEIENSLTCHKRFHNQFRISLPNRYHREAIGCEL